MQVDRKNSISLESSWTITTTNMTCKMLKTELEKMLNRKISESTFTRLKRDCRVAGLPLTRENLPIISVAKVYSSKHKMPAIYTLQLFKSFGELPALELTKEQLLTYLINRTGAHKTTIYRWLPDEITTSTVKDVILKAVTYCIKNKQDVDYPEKSKGLLK